MTEYESPKQPISLIERNFEASTKETLMIALLFWFIIVFAGFAVISRSFRQKIGIA